MITADKVKNQIQSLIDTANEKTGNNDADLTSAVGSLVEGFGGAEVLDISRYIQTINGLFQNVEFPEGTKLILILDNLKSTSATNAFGGTTGIEEIKIVADKSDLALSINSAFRTSSVKLVDLEDFHFTLASASMTFYQATSLKTIKGKLNFSEATNIGNMFFNCLSLEDIEIEPNTLSLSITFSHSSKLSDTSIQSIIDGLADLTGGTAQTLTFHADVKAKLTEEQIATITSKNWTLA